MKRNTLQLMSISQQLQLQQQNVPELPVEVVFGEIHKQVKACCLRVCEFLNWHAICHTLWREYLLMDDDAIMSLCRAKREANKSLLLKTLQVEYKNNMVRFIEFAYITMNCVRIKERIFTIATIDLFDRDLPCSTQTGFCLHRCGLLDGVSFTEHTTPDDNDSGIIATESLRILNAVATRINARYGWRVSLVYKRIGEPFLNIDLPLREPCDVPIESDIYIR